MIKIKVEKSRGVKANTKRIMCKVHSDRPARIRGLCLNCYQKWLKMTNPEYAKNQLRRCKEWQAKNKERCREIYKKHYLKQNSEYNHVKKLMNNYWMTPDDYDKLVADQNGVCAICLKPPKKGIRLHVDHDHETGIIRGLLCFRCNFGMTYFSEDQNHLKRASQYLKQANKKGRVFMNRLERARKREQQIEQNEKCKLQKTLVLSMTNHQRLEKYKSKIFKEYDAGKLLSQIATQVPFSQKVIRRVIKERDGKTRWEKD